MLIAAALVTVYIVLGILYESLVHPVTILSTLPSAGLGALLALWYWNTELSVIALIGIILLIGIVKKNAIMMIDFALDAERTQGKRPVEAIFQACLLRFRPITMTTMAAMLGALPLALGTGTGSELRYPLGITIVGGLILSQLVTLYTTPVVYLYLDRLRGWCARLRRGAKRRRGAREFREWQWDGRVCCSAACTDAPHGGGSSPLSGVWILYGRFQWSGADGIEGRRDAGHITEDALRSSEVSTCST